VDGGREGKSGGSIIINGGSLGGRGIVSSVSVNRGGTLAPGDSIGVLRVLRGVRFGPGSTYQVEVNAAGQSDRIISAHAVQIDGGTVEVLAQSGNYRSFTKYNILDANGVFGPGFDAVTSRRHSSHDARLG
jgi:fibronectin-binding autotransporter adhesin